MVSTWVSFLYPSKFNRLNGMRQLTCIRTSGWGENMYLQLYVPKQLSKFILIFHKPQLPMCKIEAVIPLRLWSTWGLLGRELSFTTQLHNAWHRGSPALLVNKILTATMPPGPASHSISEDRESCPFKGYAPLQELSLMELLEKGWKWGHGKKNRRLLRNEEEGQRKRRRRWRGTVKEELMGEEKMRGEITAKEARKDTLGTLRRSRSKI